MKSKGLRAGNEGLEGRNSFGTVLQQDVRRLQTKRCSPKGKKKSKELKGEEGAASTRTLSRLGGSANGESGLMVANRGWV